MQATRKASEASTVNISSRNAEPSFLLRLPGEIRDQILLNVVGKQKVHIVHVVLVTPERAKQAPFDWRGPHNCATKLSSGYHHCVCLADTYHDDCVIPKEANYELYHELCRMQQGKWYTDVSGETYAQIVGWTQINLSVLRVSRQLYEEASPLLWKTTKFAFTDCNSLEAFLQDSDHDQKTNLQHLELSTYQLELDYPSSRVTEQSFGSMKPGRLDKLLSQVGSLRSLTLHLTWTASKVNHQVTHSNRLKAMRSKLISHGLFSAFSGLYVLDVERINVTVGEQAPDTVVSTDTELGQLASDFRESLIAKSKSYHSSGQPSSTQPSSTQPSKLDDPRF